MIKKWRARAQIVELSSEDKDIPNSMFKAIDKALPEDEFVQEGEQIRDVPRACNMEDTWMGLLGAFGIPILGIILLFLPWKKIKRSIHCARKAQ